MRFLALGCLLLAPSELRAGPWTLPQGRLWVKTSFFQQNTDEWYTAWPQFRGRRFKTGSRLPYRFEGEFESRAVLLELFYGVTDRLDLGVQIPFFDQAFADTARRNPPSDSGFSDLRLLAKWRLLQRPLVFAVESSVKFPTGRFSTDAGLIPVGEGQWDFDFAGRLGRSFWPLPFYGAAGGGYRVRLENEEAFRDPGDEWFFRLELGYHAGSRILLLARLEGLHGRTGRAFGVKVPSQIRRISYFSPGLLVEVHGGLKLELGARITLNGRNFPAGHQLVVGISTEVDALKLLRTP